MRTVWLHDLRWPEIAEYLETSDIALVPIGATEQHGRHLPMAVDTGWAITTSEYAARKANVVVAPPLHFGWSPHHMGYAGTITLRADTLRAIAVDVADSLIYHGFRKIIFVNGNRIANLPPLEIAAVEIKNRSGAFVGIADTGLIAKVEVAKACRSPDGGLDHAGEAESAFALHWAGEHVDMSLATPRMSQGSNPTEFDYTIELDPERHGNSVSYAVSPDEHREATAPDGISHDPTMATAEQGRLMVEMIGGNIARFIEEVRHRSVGPINRNLPV